MNKDSGSTKTYFILHTGLEKFIQSEFEYDGMIVEASRKRAQNLSERRKCDKMFFFTQVPK